jgi:NADH-quinone oxidoreductase subunit M
VAPHWFLVGILGVYFNSDTRTFDLIALSGQYFSQQKRRRIFFPFLFIGFGIFTALFPFHTLGAGLDIPPHHTAGSMFLAGIIHETGGYGVLELLCCSLPEGRKYFSSVIIVLSAIAILLWGIRDDDAKRPQVYERLFFDKPLRGCFCWVSGC